MIKFLVSGLAPALLASAALASGAMAAPAPVLGDAPSWIITPTADACHTEIDLLGRSGAMARVSLVSDGQHVGLVFTKDSAPERAFLPLRVNLKPYANLVLRTGGGKSAEMILSDETLAAIRKGGTLQIGWLADEPVGAPLAGSGEGLANLKTCGAQVAAEHRALLSARAQAQAAAEADQRAKAVADEQLALVAAQRAAAEAERDRQQAAAQAETLRAQREQALAQAELRRRQQDAEDDQRRVQAQYQAQYDDDPPALPPEPQPYRYRDRGYYRPY